MIHPSHASHVVHYWFKSQKVSHACQIPEFTSFLFVREWARTLHFFLQFSQLTADDERNVHYKKVCVSKTKN